jgi:hypothetical protein
MKKELEGYQLSTMKNKWHIRVGGLAPNFKHDADCDVSLRPCTENLILPLDSSLGTRGAVDDTPQGW